MRASFKLLKPEGDTATPKELAIASQTVVRRIADLMRIVGVKSITNNMVKVGHLSLLDDRYITLINVQAPKPFETIRNEAVRSMSNYMSLFGITEIVLELDDEDNTAVKEFWDNTVNFKVTDLEGIRETDSEGNMVPERVL